MRKSLLFCLAALALFAQCRKSNVSKVDDVLPAEPQYSDTTQWYVSNRGAGIDLFYVISTETGDYTAKNGMECHFADTYSDSLRAPMRDEMLGVDMLLAGNLNYFSPYYRQCSLQSFTSDSIMRQRMPVALGDVRRAFKHYTERLNPDRPFILAGFSQGAMIILDLIKQMDDKTFARMVAAYAIGTSITQQMLDECTRIKPASGADDTGVTICYNSVRDTSCQTGVSSGNVVAINPANWHTDQTPASYETEPSPFAPIEKQKKDKLTVHLDTLTHLLIVDGYTANDYTLPLLGKEGNYHSREIWLYRDFLRKNMALRAEKFKK